MGAILEMGNGEGCLKVTEQYEKGVVATHHQFSNAVLVFSMLWCWEKKMWLPVPVMGIYLQEAYNFRYC